MNFNQIILKHRWKFLRKEILPDANSTMRVTYGQVEGYQPRDAVEYEPNTYLDGVMENIYRMITNLMSQKG